MDQILYLRKEFGRDVYATQLPSGEIIPWKPLTIEEFLEYDRLSKIKQYADVYLEDEVFCKCVLDKAYINNIGQQKAGIISAVATSILAYSGPSSPEDLNLMLEVNRRKTTEAIHSIVELICLGFPAYKPEDLYSMNYETLMLRAAQAEKKLLSSGLIKEPIKFYSQEEAAQQQEEQEKADQNKQKNQKLIDQYFEQEGIKIPDSIKQSKRERIVDHPTPPVIPDVAPGEQTIIAKADMMEHDTFMTGHEQDIVNKVQVAKDTAKYYIDYLDQIKEGGKLKIKTVEERKIAAEARMEQNKQKNIKLNQQIKEASKREIPELLKVREEARKRKARKAAARRGR